MGWDHEDEAEDESPPLTSNTSSNINTTSSQSVISNSKSSNADNNDEKIKELENKNKLLLESSENREKEHLIQIKNLQNDKLKLEEKVNNLENELKKSQNVTKKLENDITLQKEEIVDKNKEDVIKRKDLLLILSGNTEGIQDEELIKISFQIKENQLLKKENEGMKRQIQGLSTTDVLPPTPPQSTQPQQKQEVSEPMPSPVVEVESVPVLAPSSSDEISATTMEVDRTIHNDSPSSSGSDVVKVEKEETTNKHTKEAVSLELDSSIDKEGDEEWDDWS